MFVSVKERTNLIGFKIIRENKFILFQFFIWSGDTVCDWRGNRIVLVWIIALILTNVLDFEFVLGMGNILLEHY
jgi:putative ABC transport system permease protein